MPQYALVKDGVVLEYRDYAPIGDQTKLAAGKPRMLPVVVENDVFNSVTQMRDGPAIIVEPTRVVHRYTVRGKTAAEIADMRTSVIEQIRQEEMQRIEAVFPAGKQLALVALGFEGILNTGIDRAAWPAGVRNLFNPLFQTTTTTVKALHQVSTTKEAEVTAMTDPAIIAAYDATAGW